MPRKCRRPAAGALRLRWGVPIDVVSAGKCSSCNGSLRACIHGDAVDRAFRALRHVDRERDAAAQRKKGGLLVSVQEATGEAFDLAGKREGVSGSYVRRLSAVRDADAALFKQIAAKNVALNEAWKRVRRPGTIDDPETWLTPRSIRKPVIEHPNGRIDLDPCTIVQNPMRARATYSLQRKENGLSLPWDVDQKGREVRTIWVNPPYGDPLRWLKRANGTAAEHKRVGVLVLVPASMDSEHGQYALATASSILFIAGRVGFDRLDGTCPGSARTGSMICAYGNVTCTGLAIPGVVR